MKQIWGGNLVPHCSTPYAIVVDTLSFMLSAISLQTINVQADTVPVMHLQNAPDLLNVKSKDF